MKNMYKIKHVHMVDWYSAIQTEKNQSTQNILGEPAKLQSNLGLQVDFDQLNQSGSNQSLEGAYCRLTIDLVRPG